MLFSHWRTGQYQSSSEVNHFAAMNWTNPAIICRSSHHFILDYISVLSFYAKMALNFSSVIWEALRNTGVFFTAPCGPIDGLCHLVLKIHVYESPWTCWVSQIAAASCPRSWRVRLFQETNSRIPKDRTERSSPLCDSSGAAWVLLLHLVLCPLGSVLSRDGDCPLVLRTTACHLN